LAPGYTSQLLETDEARWHDILSRFIDASIYQTLPYEVVHSGRKNVGHFLLQKGRINVSAAQARLRRVPGLNKGIAYVRWGPVWNVREGEIDLEDFRQAVRALRNEYVCKRGLVLRVRPRLFESEHEATASIFREEGYDSLAADSPKRTLVLDLRKDLKSIRGGLKQKWRNCLNHAERNGLGVLEGSGDDLFKLFIDLYKEMLARKQFTEPNDIFKFRTMQKSLPIDSKMRIFIATSYGIPTAGAICSLVGQTGVYLFGATSLIGMKNNGSYLVQWKIIQWLKEMGAFFYDLNGINPERNPGTWKFKDGLSGRNGRDLSFVGQFEAYTGPKDAFLMKQLECVRVLACKLQELLLKRMKLRQG